MKIKELYEIFNGEKNHTKTGDIIFDNNGTVGFYNYCSVTDVETKGETILIWGRWYKTLEDARRDDLTLCLGERIMHLVCQKELPGITVIK